MPAVIWGLLRSYTSTFSQQDQQRWFSLLSASCSHISQVDASCFAPVALAASDAQPWVHSAKQLESELSVLEVFAAETVASALLLCKPSAAEVAGHAASALAMILEGMYPGQADALKSLQSAVQAARASADVRQLHTALKQSRLTPHRDLHKVWEDQQLMSRKRTSCQDLQK